LSGVSRVAVRDYSGALEKHHRAARPSVKHQALRSDKSLVPASVPLSLRARQWRKKTDFSDGPLTHELLIPRGPEGRPGERLIAASRSLYEPRITRDNCREDFRVLVDRHGSSFASVCLRRAEGPRPAEEGAWRTLRHYLEKGIEGTYEIAEAQIAGETAYRYSAVLRTGVLTEWKLVHAGWLYALGTISWAPSKEQEASVQRTLDVLDTWTWLPEPPIDDTQRQDAGTART
jgi:hypothetical protein